MISRRAGTRGRGPSRLGYCLALPAIVFQVFLSILFPLGSGHHRQTDKTPEWAALHKAVGEPQAALRVQPPEIPLPEDKSDRPYTQPYSCSVCTTVQGLTQFPTPGHVALAWVAGADDRSDSPEIAAIAEQWSVSAARPRAPPVGTA
jgi:hypothetical protein